MRYSADLDNRASMMIMCIELSNSIPEDSNSSLNAIKVHR